jgi:hypothetical protein
VFPVADAGPDDLPSAPPGVDRDAGSASTIAATVEAAKAAGMAHVLEISQATLVAGDPIGDLMPLPSKPFGDQNQPMQAEPPPNAGPSSPSGH